MDLHEQRRRFGWSTADGQEEQHSRHPSYCAWRIYRADKECCTGGGDSAVTMWALDHGDAREKTSLSDTVATTCMCGKGEVKAATKAFGARCVRFEKDEK